MSEAISDTSEIPAETGGVTRPLSNAERQARYRATHPKANKKRARVQVDHRYAIGKRIAELAGILRARVGIDEADPDPLLATAVEKTARLMALSEDASARALRGDPKVALDDVVRLSRASDLAMRRLRLDQRKPPATASLSSYLADRNGDPP